MLIRSLMPALMLGLVGLSSCDNSNEALSPMLQIIADRDFTLEGGGWRVEEADTLVAYSTDMTFTVKTTRSDEAVMQIGLEIGAMVDGKFTTDPQFVLVDTASMNAINRQLFIIGGNYKSVSFTADHIVIGRPNTSGWGYPYAWRVRYNDGTSDVEKTGTFKGSEQGNRWRGVLYTLENSPEPVGMLDAPDDGDWESSDPLLSRMGALPNPAVIGIPFQLTLAVSKTADSVDIDYLVSPTKVVANIYNQTLPLGQSTISVLTSALPPGLGRIRIRAYSGSTVAEAHGDIYIYKE